MPYESAHTAASVSPQACQQELHHLTPDSRRRAAAWRARRCPYCHHWDRTVAARQLAAAAGSAARLFADDPAAGGAAWTGPQHWAWHHATAAQATTAISVQQADAAQQQEQEPG